LADAVILVIKHHQTPRDAARLARQVLGQVNAEVIGTILNQVSFNKLKYGGYYYKKYRYYYGSQKNNGS
jgi:Mrp family chromosome partitioning ATPase